MTARLVLLFTCILILSGCSLVANGVAALIEESTIKEEEQVTLIEDRVVVFQDLLKQGWKIQVYKQKVLLIKETENGFIVNDVFEVLKEN